jgi:hypothetical protein
MYSVADLERLTGLTSKQVYDRLRLLSEVLDGHITVGRNGKKLISEQGFAIFNRLLELERQGLTGQTAVNQIADELKAPTSKEETPSLSAGETEVIGSLKLTIEILREENRWLRSQLESLQQLALPPAGGARRHWWTWWKGK